MKSAACFINVGKGAVSNRDIMRTGPPLRHGVAAYGDEIVSVLRIVKRNGPKGDNVLRRYDVLRNVRACALAKPDASGATNTDQHAGTRQGGQQKNTSTTNPT